MADDVQRQAQQQGDEWDEGLDQRYGRYHLGSTALLCSQAKEVKTRYIFE